MTEPAEHGPGRESLIDGIWRETSARLAGRPAIHVEPEGRTWTFAEIEERVAALVAARVAARVAPPVASPDAAPLAAPVADSVAAPVPARTPRYDARATAGEGPSRPLASSAAGNTVAFVVDFLAARRAGRTFVALDRATSPAEQDSLLLRLGSAGVPSGTAMIKVTSGSTGEARGVALSEANLLAGVRNIVATMEIGPEDVNLAAIALSHSYGFDNLVLPLILQGTPMVLLESFYPRAVLDAIARRRATFVPLVPVMYESLAGLEADWSSVRRCISAGAPLPPALAARFREGTGRKIHTFYGASECGGISFDRTDDPAPPAGCVGTPLDGVTVDLTEDGRVRVTSQAVGLGYLPRDQAASWEPGTFVTGDLGRFDDGVLILTGRAADVINVAGRKVAPAEIEACLLSLAGVGEAVVVGLADSVRGESIGAVVAPGLDERAVLAHCRERLPGWKVPRAVRIVRTLPRDARGKLARAALRALLDHP